MDKIRLDKKLTTQDQLLNELNKDVFSDEIQLPTHVDIPDKFLIKTEKYLKVLR